MELNIFKNIFSNFSKSQSNFMKFYIPTQKNQAKIIALTDVI